MNPQQKKIAEIIKKRIIGYKYNKLVSNLFKGIVIELADLLFQGCDTLFRSHGGMMGGYSCRVGNLCPNCEKDKSQFLKTCGGKP